jgi:hypothetical protein
MLIACSTTTMVTGGEDITMISGELLRRGIRRFVALMAPLDELLLPDDLLDEELLLD